MYYTKRYWCLLTFIVIIRLTPVTAIQLHPVRHDHKQSSNLRVSFPDTAASQPGQLKQKDWKARHREMKFPRITPGMLSASRQQHIISHFRSREHPLPLTGPPLCESWLPAHCRDWDFSTPLFQRTRLCVLSRNTSKRPPFQNLFA